MDRQRRPGRLEFTALVAVPLGIWLGAWLGAIAGGDVAVDFEQVYGPAARALLHGADPYPPLDSPALTNHYAFAHPPLGGLLVAPFVVLPSAVADVVITLVLIACAVGVLRVLEVRDWRCYAALLWWEPVLAAAQTANLSLMLALGVAVAWRLRDTPVAGAVVTAATIAAKVYVWPLLVWLVATRGLRAFLIAGVAGVLITVSTWALAGFDSVGHFLDVARRLTDVEEERSYTLFALLRDASVSPGLARSATWAVAVPLLVMAAHDGRRGRDGRSLAWSVGAALVLSPVVWTHYLTLLLVPLAIMRPRFGPLWVVPGALWVTPIVNPSPVQCVLGLAVLAALVLGTAVWPERRPPVPAA